MDNREAWLALNLIPAIGSRLGLSLYQAFGSVDAIFKASYAELKQIEGIRSGLAREIAAFDPEDALNKEKAFMSRHGVDFLTREDSGYPESLRHIYDPPLVLYVKGQIDPEDKISLAVVGSRRPTTYGKSVAFDLASKLAARGLTVVSGMARGIDTKAHRGALSVRGRTIAVLGTGMDCIYPAENRSLMKEIAANGAVISEFPFGTPPYKQNFPLRNRIISGMTLGTLVVEAGEVSGALITARLALEQGREVFAVPGPVNSWASRGTNGLIKQGAKLVDHIEDIFEELGPHLGPVLLKEKKQKNPSVFEQDPVLATLIDQPMHIDLLVEKTGMSVEELASRLILLEMEGIIRQLPGHMYIRI